MRCLTGFHECCYCNMPCVSCWHEEKPLAPISPPFSSLSQCQWDILHVSQICSLSHWPCLGSALKSSFGGLLHVPLDWPSFLQPLLALIHPLHQSVSGHTTFYWITVLLLSSNPWDWHTSCYYNQYYAWPLSTSCVLPMSLSMPQKSYLTYITPERHAASHLLAFASAAADIWSTLPCLQISEYFIISPPVKTSSQVPLITEWTVYFMWLHVTNY